MSSLKEPISKNFRE